MSGDQRPETFDTLEPDLLFASGTAFTYRSCQLPAFLKT